ncbi:O-antigen ligase family protein [Porphyromonas levii]|uniref:O-antigen ligase family protein n=1 Tax=Porphyromonas levii TaxID=28114 RepID=UPI001B8C9566|nr:O-antigen ligase family protein [Porphyromonas levii]
MTRKGELRRGDLLFFFFLQLVASIVSFFYSATQSIAMYDLDADKVVNNVAYDFVFLVPFLFFIRKRQALSYILLFVLVFFIIQGAKRGAIIVGATLVLLYLYHTVRKAEHQKGAYKNAIFVLIGIIVMAYVVYLLVSSNDFLAARFESLMEGNSSGRDDLYTSIWNRWWSDTNDWTHFLFGYGFAGSQQLTDGLFAHNDWLEALSNFGLVGAVLYLSLIVTGFAYALKKGWASREDRMLLLCIMTAWFLTSLFSMWYTALGVLTQTLLLGYLMGKNVNTHKFAHI